MRIDCYDYRNWIVFGISVLLHLVVYLYLDARIIP